MMITAPKSQLFIGRNPPQPEPEPEPEPINFDVYAVGDRNLIGVKNLAKYLEKRLLLTPNITNRR